MAYITEVCTGNILFQFYVAQIYTVVVVVVVVVVELPQAPEDDHQKR